MSYTFDLSNAVGSINPAQQSPAGGGFQLPPWLTSIFTPQVGAAAGNVAAGVTNFLATDAGACLLAYPPFSGTKVQRQECLRRVASGQAYAVQVGAHGGSNLASVGNLAAIGLVGFLGYQLLKK